MVEPTQTIRWLLPANSLSVFDHFVELALKVLINSLKFAQEIIIFEKSTTLKMEINSSFFGLSWKISTKKSKFKVLLTL